MNFTNIPAGISPNAAFQEMVGMSKTQEVKAERLSDKVKAKVGDMA